MSESERYYLQKHQHVILNIAQISQKLRTQWTTFYFKDQQANDTNKKKEKWQASSGQKDYIQ